MSFNKGDTPGDTTHPREFNTIWKLISSTIRAVAWQRSSTVTGLVMCMCVNSLESRVGVEEGVGVGVEAGIG